MCGSNKTMVIICVTTIVRKRKVADATLAAIFN